MLRIMLPKNPIFFLVTASLLFRSLPALADSAVTFEVLQSFDYPAALVTVANAVNEQNEVVGMFISSSGQYGFTHFRDRFGRPIRNPNDNSRSTELTGVNNAGTVCGYYLGTDRNYHSFFFSGSTFTEIDIGVSNIITGGINDANDLCGSTLAPYEAFVAIDGTPSIFSIPGAGVTEANAINNLNECIGFYSDASGVYGFRRNADGSLDYPISNPGSQSTYLYGINDLEWMVGSVVDGVGEHAVVLGPGNQHATYDYPGAGFTRFTGINSRGVISGFYQDGTGTHSFLVRVRLPAGS